MAKYNRHQQQINCILIVFTCEKDKVVAIEASDTNDQIKIIQNRNEQGYSEVRIDVWEKVAYVGYQIIDKQIRNKWYFERRRVNNSENGLRRQNPPQFRHDEPKTKSRKIKHLNFRKKRRNYNQEIVTFDIAFCYF